ncbi:hypothetical protein LJC71_04800 [Desulfosarcina sp. OttesenSCG-928-A07]|nr:hypothetical protein [Desulfosarcina sp. OttesenSCG-928-G17]MDL2329056.1 hypothetical protein [Desulfosarcina sp. OttesenSCG-928-A07]
MTKQSDRLQPWQVFHVARKYLGASTVAQIFNRQTRSAYDWAQDPACTEVRCKSPLELLHTMFERMDAYGLGYAAKAGIRYLETAIDPDADEEGAITLPLPTVMEELLEDYRLLSVLQKAIEEGQDIESVKETVGALNAAIDRTVARYIKDMEKKQ